MPRGDPTQVDVEVAEAVYRDHQQRPDRTHHGAYREYLARMRRAPGRPMICGWLDFVEWWLNRDEQDAQEV